MSDQLSNYANLVRQKMAQPATPQPQAQATGSGIGWGSSAPPPSNPMGEASQGYSGFQPPQDLSAPVQTMNMKALPNIANWATNPAPASPPVSAGWGNSQPMQDKQAAGALYGATNPSFYGR